jgi:hypothetical protein
MLGDLVKLAGIVKLIKRYESCNGLRDHGMGSALLITLQNLTVG